MKRIEPNLLLAISTGIPLVLMMMTATLFGVDGPAWRYPLMATLCAVLFVLLQRPMQRMMKRPEPPALINPANPSTAVWAMILPGLVLVGAAIPVFVQGFDYGIVVIMASVVFAQTLDSAIRARRNA